jgi:hypothetical protein
LDSGFYALLTLTGCNYALSAYRLQKADLRNRHSNDRKVPQISSSDNAGFRACGEWQECGQLVGIEQRDYALWGA